MDDDPLLTIGVFARRSRLSMKALRLYDRLGLLTPAHVDPDSGYRRYRESQLATARLVAMLRRLDMPLASVLEVVSAPGEDGAGLVAGYWSAIERRIASQRELAAHIQERLLGAEPPRGRWPVRLRRVAAQLVLTEQRHILVPDLSCWIGETSRRLERLAGGRERVTGPMFVVYHGEVNEDSDGPVELCMPVARAPAGAATRREPAHREAYARLVRAQVEYPQILSAFDAVAAWTAASSLSITASPREVYFGDWDAAGPADEVCDVAFPVD